MKGEILEKDRTKYISDGFGSTWINWCEVCKKSGCLEIVKPGKVQCNNCIKIKNEKGKGKKQ